MGLFSARVSIAEGTHRSQEGFLHAQFRFTGVSDRRLKGSYASQEETSCGSPYYSIVLELGLSETPHTEETPGWCSRAHAPGVLPESAVYFLYSLVQEGARDRSTLSRVS